jgi:hypothetical protein
MPVTVHEVDVSAAETKTEPAPERGGGESAPPSPEELQRMLEQQLSRCERVWAY